MNIVIENNYNNYQKSIRNNKELNRNRINSALNRVGISCIHNI
jgi:hypothetical protein